MLQAGQGVYEQDCELRVEIHQQLVGLDHLPHVGTGSDSHGAALYVTQNGANQHGKQPR
jgi:hypothetical protein